MEVLKKIAQITMIIYRINNLKINTIKNKNILIMEFIINIIKWNCI